MDEVQTTQSIDLKVGESMRIGDATVTLQEKSGQRAKLKIVADAEMIVRRMVSGQPASQASRGVMMESRNA